MDSPSSLRLSIVYVSWNTADELQKSLESLIATGIPEDTEVLVVDNASTDGTPERVRAIFPRVRLIVNTENRGFAAAFNQGWRAATGRYCLLLNPDTLISSATLSIMLNLMEEGPTTLAACAPVLLGEAEEPTDNARPFPPLTLRLDKGVRSRPHGEPLNVPTGPWGKVTRAHWLMGACMLIRRDALEGTKGFDEGYFMYGEDIDWGYRAFCASWDLAVLEEQRATHLGGRSAAQVEWGLGIQRVYDGYFRFLSRAHGGFAARANFLWWVVKGGVAAMLLAPFALFSTTVRRRHGSEHARFLFSLTHLGKPFLLCRFGRNHAPRGDKVSSSIRPTPRPPDPRPLNEDPPRVSVVIVNWNTRELLRACLQSLREQGQSVNLEPIVVDNGSTDGSVEMVEQEFPSVRVIFNRENVGFVRATNQGLRAATGDFLFLLNSDAEVRPGCVERLVDVAANAPTIGAVGPRLLNTDGSHQISVCPFPRIIHRLFPARFEARYHLQRQRLLETSKQDTVRVDWIAGAALLFRREALERVGPLDERYFMWYDDVDWCQKLRKERLDRVFVANAEVIHHVRQSGRQLDEGILSEQLFDSEYTYLRLHAGLLATWLVYAMRIGKASLRWAFTCSRQTRSDACFRLSYHWRQFGRFCLFRLPGSASSSKE